MAGIPIGQILVEQGVLTQRQVDHIVELQRRSHRPFGDLAERIFGVSPEAIEDAWVEQYTRQTGTIDLDDLEMDERVLRLINRRQAWQFQVLPAGRMENTLQVATDAEHLVRAVNFSTRRLDEPVAMLIAERTQLRDFLMRHYPVPEHMAEFAEKM